MPNASRPLQVLSLCSQGEEFVRYVLSKAERARKLTQDRGAKAGANPEPRGQPAQSRASSRDLASADSGRLGRRTSAVGDGRGAVSRQSSARGLAGQGDGGGAGAVDEDNDCLGLPSTVPEEQASSTVRSGPFCSIVRELLGHYVGLEEYYMESAVQTGECRSYPSCPTFVHAGRGSCCLRSKRARSNSLARLVSFRCHSHSHRHRRAHGGRADDQFRRRCLLRPAPVLPARHRHRVAAARLRRRDARQRARVRGGAAGDRGPAGWRGAADLPQPPGSGAAPLGR